MAATAFTLFLSPFALLVRAEGNGKEVTERPVGQSVEEAQFPALAQLDPTTEEFLRLMNRPDAPPLEYWERLARCETDNDWQNPGRHGGGLGFFTQGTFAQSTMGGWERFGGEDYAGHPKDATRREQLIVAARTAYAGWYGRVVDRGADVAKRKGVPRFYVWDRDPFGYWTWGCAKRVVGDPCGYLFDGTVIPLAHAKPAYCRHLKPINYSALTGKVGNTRYEHNRNIRIAQEKAGAAPSVAIWGAANEVTGGTTATHASRPAPKDVSAPAGAKCPEWWPTARASGWPEAALPALDVLIWTQSRCRADAHDKTNPDGNLLGLTQLSQNWTKFLRENGIIWSTIDLFQPGTNLDAAWALYRYHLRRDGWGWAAWGYAPGQAPAP